MPMTTHLVPVNAEGAPLDWCRVEAGEDVPTVRQRLLSLFAAYGAVEVLRVDR